MLLPHLVLEFGGPGKIAIAVLIQELMVAGDGVGELRQWNSFLVIQYGTGY